MIFGLFFHADLGGLDVFQNFLTAVAGNMVGGLAFVTLTRTGQAIGSSDSEGPTED
jgi:formate/nitrite transporter FocA (FNT family)